ncbi:Cytochrome b-c1 complex subunit [Thalictrum thalictroides]|uniref:Complex III subunit VI n=1 Tax=Thalictrum thalictroides TaxID=46969 RepID=A0A7J6VWJ5_THATH|nr:Cytochrome b-c1 complex subunit [Thalictrum thalictroides]
MCLNQIVIARFDREIFRSLRTTPSRPSYQTKSRRENTHEACVKRIEGDESGHKHCTGQYFDYWSCVDKAVAPKLFEKLK